MRVSSAEFLKAYGRLSDQALTEPVTITRNGRDRLVLMSVTEFERVRRFVPHSRLPEELSDEEVALIAASEMPAEYDGLNALLDD